MPGCMRGGILKSFSEWLHADIKKQGLSEDVKKAWDMYYYETLTRPSMTDNLQMSPV